MSIQVGTPISELTGNELGHASAGMPDGRLNQVLAMGEYAVSEVAGGTPAPEPSGTDFTNVIKPPTPDTPGMS